MNYLIYKMLTLAIPIKGNARGFWEKGGISGSIVLESSHVPP